MREPLLLYRSVQCQSNNSFQFEQVALNGGLERHHLDDPHHLRLHQEDEEEQEEQLVYEMTDFDYQRQSLLQVERHSARYTTIN